MAASTLCLALSCIAIALLIGYPCSSLIISSTEITTTSTLLVFIIKILPLGMLFFLVCSCFTAQYWPLIKAHTLALLLRHPPLPPGTMGLPYWGETLEYLSSWSHPINPDRWFDTRRAKYGNTFRTFLLGTPTIVMLGPDANKLVLSNENRLFENNWPKSLRALEGDNAVSMVYGETHARLRRAINVFLNKNTLSEFCGSIEDVVMRCIKEDWLQASKAKFPNQNVRNLLAYPALQKFAFQLNAELFMGLRPGPELERLHTQYENFTAGLESQPLDLPWTVFGKAKRARVVLLKYMLNKIESRRSELEEQMRRNGGAAEARDLLDVLLMSKDAETGKLYTVDEIGDNMLLLVHAGQDTTAGALAIILIKLAQSPALLSELISECRAMADGVSKRSGEGDQGRGMISREELKSMKLLRNVIREGLRLCPPVSGFFKRVKCDVVHDGYTIPKGWTVHLSARHSHLKPEYFSNPEVFDPERFAKRYGNFGYIPFGQGARICPGMKFANISMGLFLYHLLSSIQDMQLVNPNEKMIPRTFSPFPEHNLPINLLVRTP